MVINYVYIYIYMFAIPRFIARSFSGRYVQCSWCGIWPHLAKFKPDDTIMYPAGRDDLSQRCSAHLPYRSWLSNHWPIWLTKHIIYSFVLVFFRIFGSCFYLTWSDMIKNIENTNTTQHKLLLVLNNTNITQAPIIFN